MRALPALVVMLVAAQACSPQRPPAFRDATRLEQEMWQRVGRELATLAAAPAGEGSRVLLLRAGEKTGIALEQNAVEQSLREHLVRREIVVVTLPNQPRSPDQIAAHMPDLPQELRADWLTGVLGKQAPVAAVVSLSGEPAGPPSAGVKWPPVICFAACARERLSGLIRSGAVTGAVAPRHGPPEKGEDDWFSLRYTVLRKDNVDAW